MQYTVCKRMTFAAAHRLRGYPGKCADLHGHNYTVEVFMRAPKLDALGMVIDFSILKDIVGEWLNQHWDHAAVLHELDPLRGVPKIYALTDNPTAEVMAEHLFEMLEKRFSQDANNAVVHRVRVWETEDSFAEVESGN